jgi:hypothetical protein
LKSAFLGLNYKAQFDPFENWVNNYKMGAFLIRGEPNRGQRWLVNRLVYQKFPHAYDSGKLITIQRATTKKEQDSYRDDVWTKLGRQLGLQNRITAEKCVEQALERWKNETLIIAFYVDDNIYPQEIRKLIDDFWKPLEKRASIWIDINHKIESYLLMFLIDSLDRAFQCGLDMIDSDDKKNGDSQKLIALPKIDNFSQTLDKKLLPLGEPTEKLRKLLGCPENSSPGLQEVMETILYNSQGLPQDTFEAICARVGCTWSDIESTLKL